MVAPTGVRNLAETIVEFIEDGIVMQTMGRDGSAAGRRSCCQLFIFIFLCNMPGIIPIIADAGHRPHGHPAVRSALLVWVIYIGVGIKHQGLGYFGHLLWPPGVPTALKPLVGAHRVHLDDPRPARSR